MNKIDIKFKIVTPCIMSGANQKLAELRAPSIRGQLRFWFRVMGGTIEEEKTIFGGIGKGDEGRASSVVVRIKTARGDIKTISDQTMNNILPEVRYDYFLWPLRNSSNARGVIKENQTIELQISNLKNLDEQIGEKTIKAFLLLGSLGTRSRRCYGSIFPEKVVFNNKEWIIPANIEQFKSEIKELLKDTNSKIIQIDVAKQSWKDAICSCSNYLKIFRSGGGQFATPSEWGKSDHDLMFQGNYTDEIYRPAIGLPYSTKYYKADVNGYKRLASPVLFKIIQFQDKYIPIAIFLKDYFIPENTIVNIVDNRNSRNTKNVNISHDLLNEMMKENSKYWDNAKVLFDSK